MTFNEAGRDFSASQRQIRRPASDLVQITGIEFPTESYEWHGGQSSRQELK